MVEPCRKKKKKEAWTNGKGGNEQVKKRLKGRSMSSLTIESIRIEPD